MLLVVTVVALAFGGAGTVWASPSPSARVSASRAALDAALRQYDSAAVRLAAVEASIARNTGALDELVARQTDLEARLSTRARAMYRSGPLGFIEVLAGSTSFDQFLTTWDALVRFNRQDAQTIAELGRARARISDSGTKLLQQQAELSRQLRALEAAKAKAGKQLADDQAALADFKRQVAAREAQATSTRTARVQSARSTRSPKAPSVPQRTGSGPWQTGVASHYGTGSYGIRLSSGVTIGPDSMIVAHKTLPFGTLVEFSYRGRTAVAKVADRGPYTKGRDWDLGPGVIRILGFRGVDKVNYRVIGR